MHITTSSGFVVIVDINEICFKIKYVSNFKNVIQKSK